MKKMKVKILTLKLKKMNREEKIREIITHSKKIGSNLTTLISVLAFTTDKGMTKFHNTYLKIKKYEK